MEFGCRVVVPFRKRDMEGFVVGLRNDAPDIEIHPITKVIDPSPLLRKEIFELCRWISKYYVSPLGEVLKGALPPGIKSVGSVYDRTISRNFEIVGGHRPPLQLTPEQLKALDAIRNTNGFRTLLLHGITG